MKRRIWITIVVLLASTSTAFSQAAEIQQLVLDYQKLAQLKNILNEMYKGYQIATTGYNAVKDASKGNFDLHKAFIDGLMAVSPTVRNYKRITDIINDQATLVKEYKQAYNQYKSNGRFSSDELTYMMNVYNNLINESVRNLDELTMVVTAGKLSMSDDERLRSIDHIADDMNDKLVFLRHFNNRASILAVQRTKDLNDQQTVQNIYGIK